MGAHDRETSTEFLNKLFPPNEINKDFRERLIRILEYAPDFPSFPAAISKLQEKLNRTDTTFSEIADIVRLDPGLTGRIFSLVRSAAFAGVEVYSIENALFRLGLKETRNIILTAKLMNQFTHLKVEIDWNKFWLHSLVTARLTQGIGDIFKSITYKHYMAGLLHDIGKVVLAYYFPQEFETALKQSRESGLPMFHVEQTILGTDHAAIGAAIGFKWGLDEENLNALQYHHYPEQEFLTYCVHVADIVANRYVDNIHSSISYLSEPDPEPPPEDQNHLADSEGEKVEQQMDNITTIPEWHKFNHMTPRRIPTLIIQEECAKARDLLRAMIIPAHQKVEE